MLSNIHITIITLIFADDDPKVSEKVPEATHPGKPLDSIKNPRLL